MKFFFARAIIKIAFLLRLSESKKEFVITFAEVVVTNQYHAFKYIKKDSVVIDVGAFIGMFTLLASFLGKEVHAFEPHPKTFARLKKFAGWRKNVRLYNAGLGDRREMRDFIMHESTGASTFADSGSRFIEVSKNPTVKVQVLTLDELNLKPDFIKMDCEGYEARVIDGGRKTIEECLPVIVTSAYHHWEDKEELPKKLPNYDYVLKKEGFEEDFTFIPRLRSLTSRKPHL